jgi:hypothetical protein
VQEGLKNRILPLTVHLIGKKEELMSMSNSTRREEKIKEKKANTKRNLKEALRSMSKIRNRLRKRP